ncbi:MAG: putative rane protein [Frankiaceae bacterium]|nr:putative rane protein [Frankiaceae bacterium]MDQ1633793.1 putative rane protein [Frankiaceae bacterium]MDQ1648986.1 putative rane protein [Frankiaceae bacterium]MDQ1672860.1 putative rane protein [Frankiaceae bacterium]
MSEPERKEPDYRFTLANERTFLAWIRTSLALLAAAVALGHLVPDFGPDVLRRAAAVALALGATATAVGSVVRWRKVQDAVERSEPLPRSHGVWALSALLFLVAVFVLVLVLVSGDA